jgi:glycosyltransferase involved in cell wall biosynthesis
MQRKFLFIHQNFPGQFVHAASALARAGHEVVALGTTPRQLPGVRTLRYQVPPGRPRTGIALAQDLENQMLRGTACAQAMTQLRKGGFAPDLVVGHPGWGELLFCKDVWPRAPLAMFAEFFYRTEGSDYGFDREFARDTPLARSRLRLKNTVHLHALHAADAVLAPTRWQQQQLPREYRDKVRVIFDGIDTAAAQPDPHAWVELPAKGLRLTRDDEVITFVNRNLEPYRGFHVFMRALPRILHERPRAHCLIVGGDQVSYGRGPEGGGNWREALLRELGDALPRDRVHFLGRLPYAHYLKVLQVSSCHVYLTYPFVLSWSCLEAMSAGCVVVGSRTPPVQEVLEHGRNGLLVDFFDTAALAGQVVRVLADRPAHAGLAEQARAHVTARYDLRTVCLPQQLDWLLGLAAGATARPAAEPEFARAAPVALTGATAEAAALPASMH